MPTDLPEKKDNSGLFGVILVVGVLVVGVFVGRCSVEEDLFVNTPPCTCNCNCITSERAN